MPTYFLPAQAYHSLQFTEQCGLATCMILGVLISWILTFSPKVDLGRSRNISNLVLQYKIYISTWYSLRPITVALIIPIYLGHFDSNDFLWLNCPIMQLALSYGSIYTIYIERLNLATTFEIFFCSFIFHFLCDSWAKYRCLTPVFPYHHLFSTSIWENI